MLVKPRLRTTHVGYEAGYYALQVPAGPGAASS